MKIKSILLVIMSKLRKRERTKDEYMQDIENLLKKAEVDYARKRIRANSSIHEYEKVKGELLLSRGDLLGQIGTLEQMVIDNHHTMDKMKSIEIGAKILSLKNIIDNLDKRIGQIDQFVSVAKESLSEQHMKHIEICTTLKIKKSDLISFDIINQNAVDESIFSDIKNISREIESDIDEMEISIQAKKIFSDSISGRCQGEVDYLNDNIESVLSEIINRKKKQ